MPYSSDILDKRITIAQRANDGSEGFGKRNAPRYVELDTIWAAEAFTRGTKAMREGALDAYDTIMLRFRWLAGVDRWCLIRYEGRWYQITSYHDSYRENIIQITAQELANQDVNLITRSALYGSDGAQLLGSTGAALVCRNEE